MSKPSFKQNKEISVCLPLLSISKGNPLAKPEINMPAKFFYCYLLKTNKFLSLNK